ncbi:MAG: hypothetical protein ACRDE2_00310 [Chitinophagaceae bacterium]
MKSSYSKRRDRIKDKFTWSLWIWANQNNMQLQKEYKFHPVRKWRFDFYFKKIKVGIEYEGVFSTQSRHTNKMGYSRDTDKYREAAKMGLIVLRYTAANANKVIEDLDEILLKNKILIR